MTAIFIVLFVALILLVLIACAIEVRQYLLDKRIQDAYIRRKSGLSPSSFKRLRRLQEEDQAQAACQEVDIET